MQSIFSNALIRGGSKTHRLVGHKAREHPFRASADLWRLARIARLWRALSGPISVHSVSASGNPVPGGVAGLVGIEGGVVSGVFNLESSGVEASDWRPRHDERYHEA